MAIDACDHIKTLSTGSRLGQMVIETLVDCETGQRVTLAFADGCPIDYPIFLQVYLGHLTHTVNRLNESSRQIKERIMPLWSRVSLPDPIMRRLEKLSICHVLEFTVREFYIAHARRADMTELEQIALFAEQVEMGYEYSLANPVSVTGLSELYEPLFYKPSWKKTKESATKEASSLLSMFAAGHL